MDPEAEQNLQENLEDSSASKLCLLKVFFKKLTEFSHTYFLFVAFTQALAYHTPVLGS